MLDLEHFKQTVVGQLLGRKRKHPEKLRKLTEIIASDFLIFYIQNQ